jgi:hypothetical protein
MLYTKGLEFVRNSILVGKRSVPVDVDERFRLVLFPTSKRSIVVCSMLRVVAARTMHFVVWFAIV